MSKKHLWSYFGRLAARNKSFRCIILMQMLVIGVLSISLSLAAALSLSGEQKAAEIMGRYAFKVDIPSGMSGEQILAQANIPGQEISIIPWMRMAEIPDRSISLIEADWGREPFPDRFRIDDGHFPIQTNEAVLSKDLGIDLGATVNMHGVNLRVVGHVKTLLGDRNIALLTKPSEPRWETDRVTRINQLLWDDSSAKKVQQIMVSKTAQKPPQILSRTALAKEKLRNILIDDSGLVFGPGLALVFMLSIGASLLVSGWNKNRLYRMSCLGVNQKQASIALTSYFAALALIYSVAGALLGVLIGAIIWRVISFFHPVSPYHFYPDRLFLLVATSTLGMGFGHILNYAFVSLRKILLNSLKKCLSVSFVGLLALVISGIVMGGVPGLYLTNFAGALCCVGFIPALVNRAFSIKHSDLIPLIVEKIYLRKKNQIIAISVLLALVGVIPLSISTTLASREATINQNQIQLVPTGVALIGADGIQVSADAVHQLEQRANVSGSVQIFQLGGIKSDGLTNSMVVLPKLETKYGNGIVAFRTIEDIEKFSGIHLKAQQKEILKEGGFLGGGLSSRTNLVVTTFLQEGQGRQPVEGEQQKEKLEVPGGELKAKNTWASYGAVTLTDTADKLGLVSTPLYLFYDLSNDQISSLRMAADTMKLPSGALTTDTEAEQIPVPVALLVASWLIVFLVAAMLWIISRQISKELQPIMSTMYANGMRSRWGKKVLFRFLFPILVSALLIALLAGLFPSFLISIIGAGGLMFSVNWLILSLVVVGYVVGGYVSAGFAAHSARKALTDNWDQNME